MDHISKYALIRGASVSTAPAAPPAPRQDYFKRKFNAPVTLALTSLARTSVSINLVPIVIEVMQDLFDTEHPTQLNSEPPQISRRTSYMGPGRRL